MQNIVIFGFMGTGKTTVGRLVADKLSRRFVDMDVVIEERAGQKISAIFAQHGEPYFRSLERSIVQELALEKDLVIATGGGVILNKANVDDLQRNGVLFCLMAAPETILRRVQHDNARPLLAGDKANRVLSLLAERRSLYESLPCVIQTDNLTPEGVSEIVVQLFRERAI